MELGAAQRAAAADDALASARVSHQSVDVGRSRLVVASASCLSSVVEYDWLGLLREQVGPRMRPLLKGGTLDDKKTS